MRPVLLSLLILTLVGFLTRPVGAEDPAPKPPSLTPAEAYAEKIAGLEAPSKEAAFDFIGADLCVHDGAARS